MYTECPQCSSVLGVTVENLRFAMGMVRCTTCSNVFNALVGLRAEGEVDRSKVVEVGAQLPFLQMGDVAVLDASTGKALFQQLREATMPRAVSAADLARRPVATAAPAAPVPAPTEDVAPDEARAAPGRTLFGWIPPDVLLAARNLTRHRKRTGLALGAIGFGVIALLLAGGFMEWILWAMRETSIQAEYGHVQVTKPNFLTQGVSEPFEYLLPPDSKAATIITSTPHVQRMVPRLSFSGLASVGNVTLPYLAQGVDPATDGAPNMGFAITKGEPIVPEDPTGIVVGMGLADILQVKPGDTITLLVNTATGGLNGKEVHVRGIFYTSNSLVNETLMRVPLPLAQDLLRVDGAQTWVAFLDDTAATDGVVAALSSRLQTAKGEFEITPWTRLADFYNKTVGLFSRQMNVVRLIIGVIIVLSISNVLVMGVMQRTAEIGTLMALGHRRGKILRLFVTEGALLGVVGGVGGALVGLGLAELISYFGIPMPPAPGMDTGFTAEIIVTWPLFISTVLLATLTTLAASFYPAWKASRLEIVNALRHSR